MYRVNKNNETNKKKQAFCITADGISRSILNLIPNFIFFILTMTLLGSKAIQTETSKGIIYKFDKNLIPESSY
jgi:hypothetical protein